jgi:magnesium-protoporphyrin IX monomethyl ester (oxidative) cyclase
LLAVYATMYVRDHRRPLLHEAMGLESTAYDYEVFRITNEITQQVFPIALDIDHPAFRSGLTRLVEIADAFDAAKNRGGLSGLLGKVWHGSRAFVQFAKLFLLPVRRQELLEQPRMRPTW